MNTIWKRLALGIVAASGLAMAATPVAPLDSAQIGQKVVHEIRMYPKYSIFDNVKIRVDNGNVELFGQVSQPFKKADLQRLATHVPGVTSVTNDLEVLPLSPMDNRLRVQVARAVYRDPVLSRYSIEPLPPIHIIVDNGHVTLEGVVSTEMEKDVAGVRANSTGLSFGQVVNNLQVENPAPGKS